MYFSASTQTPTEYTPEHGWVIELQDAKKAAKKAKGSAKDDDDNALQILAQFRVARAYHKLRQYKACKAASSLCLALKPHVEHKKLLMKFRSDADAYLNKDPVLQFDNDLKKTHADFMAGRREVNGVLSPHSIIRNTNRLQACAIMGDVQNLEIAIKYGAALDFPFFSQKWLDQVYRSGGKERFGYLKEVVPSDNTALLLVCALLCQTQVNLETKLIVMNEDLRETVENLVECAEVLIMLGADVKRKLRLHPRNDDVDDLLITNFHQRDFGGKSVIELVERSRQPRLAKAIRAMMTDDLKIANAYCRCGSRLRWRDCHAGGPDEEDSHHTTSFKGKLCFRYSPMARCPCDLTEKPYFDCCWNSGKRIHCFDDTTTYKEPKMRCETGEKVLNMVNTMRSTKGGGVFWSKIFEHVGKGGWLEMVKISWDAIYLHLTKEEREKSLIDTYDRKVYIGVLERLETPRVWSGVHWNTGESELLEEVKNWNEALERYCDDQGLNGEARRTIVKRHAASPLAPCGCYSCNKVEKKVKSLRLCSRCKAIAYCDRNCQKEDWRRHKLVCGKQDENEVLNAILDAFN
eukprot:CAMPEP_0116010476 /NCGR_PEP_ID=MMETSP0321-20121206/4022_1 /TAXON_ID=163516 /ORGANISM="Leptocylindrus danicus var. danicus, Strain B650" /LENGTH=575 /DNA_ID=CAMNT_0003479579 /DNA_START=38 /DNA_END=1766 /DNA_ORIENTATION=+